MYKFALTKQLTRFGRLGRSILKRFIYSQMAIRNGIMIAIGKEQPLVHFTVEKDPPSVYWVFRIKPTEIEDLAKKLEIPPRFSLCPIKCLATDEPQYLLTLNVYRVSGITNGTRAEWSICVRDGDDGTPRYMVVDARSSQSSMDPVNVITRASYVSHIRDGDTIHTQVGEGDLAFSCTITLPNAAPIVASSTEWVTANDHIFWGNGISDRTFYNAGLADARQHRLGGENAV
ncbi:MAG: hypothetical protein R3307_06025, partial [Anaerolineales bacterium]|nr:hypothetical protein [Anaerolineales bacterium]